MTRYPQHLIYVFSSPIEYTDDHPYSIHGKRSPTFCSTQNRYFPSVYALISIHIWVQGRGDLTPRHLRVYANHNTIIDFVDAESTNPLLNISLLEGEIGVTEYPLRVAAFSDVHSVSLFFVRPSTPHL